jgi:hypothetical protein
MTGRDGRQRPRVDTRQSADWRPGGPAGAKPRRPKHRADPTALDEEDLDLLGGIHDLLSKLNDAYAGGTQVAALIEKIPVLAARCTRRAAKRFPGKQPKTLAEALTLIGNMGLEAELLQLLEDLTVLRADLDEAGQTAKPVK